MVPADVREQIEQYLDQRINTLLAVEVLEGQRLRLMQAKTDLSWTPVPALKVLEQDRYSPQCISVSRGDRKLVEWIHALKREARLCKKHRAEKAMLKQKRRRWRVARLWIASWPKPNVAVRR